MAAAGPMEIVTAAIIAQMKILVDIPDLTMEMSRTAIATETMIVTGGTAQAMKFHHGLAMRMPNADANAIGK